MSKLRDLTMGVEPLRISALKMNSFRNRFQRHVSRRHFGFTLSFPSRHPILRMLRENPNYEAALRAVSRVVLKDKRHHFIDVGANVGDTVAAIKSSATTETYGDAIEASAYFFNFLSKNRTVLEPLAVHRKFASTTYPPSPIKGVFHHWEGNAEVVQVGNNTIAPEEDQISISSLLTDDTGLIKIDCEGQDLDILHAMLAEGVKSVPTVFLEIQLRSVEASTKLLSLISPHGPFSKLVLFDPYGHLVFAGDSKVEISSLFEWQYSCHERDLRWAVPYFDAALFPLEYSRSFDSLLEIYPRGIS